MSLARAFAHPSTLMRNVLLQPLMPPHQTKVTPMIGFPGVALRGESVLDTLSTKQPKRIPTVYSPFHAGWTFRVAPRESPPGVTLNFSNMTLMLANVTYDGIYDSGFMEFFDLGRSGRFCFTNRFDNSFCSDFSFIKFS